MPRVPVLALALALSATVVACSKDPTAEAAATPGTLDFKYDFVKAAAPNLKLGAAYAYISGSTGQELRLVLVDDGFTKTSCEAPGPGVFGHDVPEGRFAIEFQTGGSKPVTFPNAPGSMPAPNATIYFHPKGAAQGTNAGFGNETLGTIEIASVDGRQLKGKLDVRTPDGKAHIRGDFVAKVCP